MDNKDDLIESIQSEEEDIETGVPIYKIVSYPSDPTLEGLYTKYQRGEIIIPKYQRGWVWKPTQASRLVESFLLGLPVPAVFVYKESSEKQVIIDGQQRLRTIWGFFEEKLPDGSPFYLRGVDAKWEGKYYSTLSEIERVRFRDSTLRQVIVEQLDPQDKTSIYHIFERLNTGGTGLTPQEVRNCTYHGPFNDLIVELNKESTWRRIFGSDEADARMRDLELIVRFLALFEKGDSYYKPMKQFLNDFMGSNQWNEDLDQYRTIFLDTVKKVHRSLGDKPFNIRRGINVAVFDSIMVAFAESRPVPGDIKRRFEKLIKNPSYDQSVTSGTTAVDTVKNRIKLAREILFG